MATDERTKPRKFGFALLGLITLLPATADAVIYFNARIAGPVTNIYCIDRQGAIKKLTDNNSWRDLQPDVSVRGDMAFASNREAGAKIDLQRKSENFNIYIADRRARKLRQLTADPGRETSPRFSPDGRRLAYLGEAATGGQGLYLIGRDGSRQRLLAKAEQIFDFAWSPGGDAIAFAAVDRQRSTITLVDVQSQALRPLIEVSSEAETASAAHLVAPQWSPDGRAIAYIRHPLRGDEVRSVFVVRPQAQAAAAAGQRVSAAGVQAQAPLTWSADSRRLLYAGLVDYRYRYDERLHRKVYDGGMQIFVSEPGAKTRQLTRGNHLHARPVFSPDGRSIAYLYADKLGGARSLSLRTMNLDGSDLRELYTNVARQSSLIWR